MRSEREKKLLHQIRRLHTEKLVASRLRGIPDTSVPLHALRACEAKLAQANEMVLKRNQEAAASRILIANLQKALDNARRDLGRDANVRENGTLRKALADLEARYNTLNTEYRALQAASHELGNLRYQVAELRRARDHVKERARDELKKEFEEQIELWQKRALECGWVDPSARSEHEKLREVRLAEILKNHPEMTEADAIQMLETQERFLNLEL